MSESAQVATLANNLLLVGQEVRQLRKARGLTLKELSTQARISLSHLSSIERGASNPSMEVLAGVAAALDVTPDWFFARRSGAGPLERACVVRSRNRRDLNTLYAQSAHELGYSDDLLSSSIGGAFYMGLSTYEPFSEQPDGTRQTHEGEQHGFILEGELEMQIGEETVTLRTGDSYSFDARLPHHASNRTDRVCKLVWAVSPVVIPRNVEKVQATDTQEPHLDTSQ